MWTKPNMITKAKISNMAFVRCEVLEKKARLQHYGFTSSGDEVFDRRLLSLRPFLGTWRSGAHGAADILKQRSIMII